MSLHNSPEKASLVWLILLPTWVLGHFNQQKLIRGHEVGGRRTPGLDMWCLSSGIKFELCSPSLRHSKDKAGGKS